MKRIELGNSSWHGQQLLAGILFVIYLLLLAWGAWVTSPTVDEVAHLPAGLSHWQMGRFDLYRVNPPLVRLVAALPVLAVHPYDSWPGFDSVPGERPEFTVGTEFMQRNGPQARWFFALGRWACLIFPLLGAVAVWHWAGELFGGWAGLLALLLWCLCPNLLGHGMLLTPDVAGTALAATAGYAFWRWLKQPSWRASFLVGLWLGLAQLAKTTNLLLVALLPLYWLLVRWRSAPLSWRREGAQLATQLALAWLVLNGGYGFEGFGKPLGKYVFVSRWFAGEIKKGEVGNRFAGSWLENLPVPLPANYVQGIDEQRLDFEMGLLSYLRGEFRRQGWWYYYLYALGVKLPLGTLGILTISWVLPLWCGRGGLRLREEAGWLLPGLGYLLFVSSQTGFSHHLRYVFPALPFFFVGASRLWSAAWWEVKGVRWLVGVLLLATAVSGLRIYPHSLSYFNELAGGPLGGPQHLLDSNIDWGQDLYYLESWAKEHPEARPLYVAFFNLYEPWVLCPELSSLRELTVEPRPGWYAVSVNYLYGYGLGGLQGNCRDHYGYFRWSSPVAYAGYSIYIYHLDLAEANRLRWQLGLPPLPASPEQPQNE